jgi:transposase-like protein
MLLALDAGNSNITIGAFEGSKLIRRWRVRTIHEQTADEWGVLIRNLLLSSPKSDDVDGIVIASVVPKLDGFVGTCRDGVCCGTVTSKIEQERCTSCPHCDLPNVVKNGRDRRGAQVYRCADCGRSFTALTGTPFSGHSFPPAVIGLAVRWYLRFRLSYADLVEWLAERSIQVDASTVFDWVQKFAPLYQEAAKAHRYRVGHRWSVDET